MAKIIIETTQRVIANVNIRRTKKRCNCHLPIIWIRHRQVCLANDYSDRPA